VKNVIGRIASIIKMQKNAGKRNNNILRNRSFILKIENI